MKEMIYKCLILFFTITNCFADVVYRHFEYKCSFKAPYLAQYDGSIPFWSYAGNAIASSENLRIAPSLKSQKGAVWLKNPISFDWWEVDFTFRISGRGRIGADGLAFWYTVAPGDVNGPVFGSSDRWNGLGIIFDSFDNDNKHNNPFIMAVVNDGTKSFDHANDGAGQMLDGCLRDFRNKLFSTRAKIEYYNNVLTVLFHSGNTNEENDFEICMRVPNVVLPRNGYFGLSAATGGLADDHDVKYFLTHSLHAERLQTTVVNKTTIGAEDKQKLEEKYTEFQQKLDTQREQYKKEHPDSVKESDLSEWFESDDQREFNQLFSLQNQMHETVRGLSTKLDWLVQQQEKMAAPLAQGSNTVSQYTQDMLHKIHNSLTDSRNFMTDVHRKTEQILAVQQQQPTGRAEVALSDTASVLNELRHDMKSLKTDIANVAHKLSLERDSACKNISCLSPSMFFLIMCIPCLLLVVYFYIMARKDADRKKFY